MYSKKHYTYFLLVFMFLNNLSTSQGEAVMVINVVIRKTGLIFSLKRYEISISFLGCLGYFQFGQEVSDLYCDMTTLTRENNCGKSRTRYIFIFFFFVSMKKCLQVKLLYLCRVCLCSDL